MFRYPTANAAKIQKQKRIMRLLQKDTFHKK